MELIKAVIVDDEIEGINTLNFMLEQYCPNVKVIQKYQSSKVALKNIKKEKPDLLFLDIKMPNINGLELLELLGPENYSAIFTTAYNEFMLQALRMNALDFLKKPISETDLVNAVEKVKPQGYIIREQVLEALKYIKREEISLQSTYRIKDGNKIKLVKLSDICYCKSDGNFTYVFLSNGERICSSDSLGKIEKHLPEKYFFRSHREYLVNGHHIKEYNRSDGGSITLTNNKIIPISRGKREEFLVFLDKFSEL